MIKNYNQFIIYAINESLEDDKPTKESFDKVYKISQIVKNMESHNNVYVGPYSNDQYLNNPNLYHEDFLKFESCLEYTSAGVSKSLLSSMPYNEYKRGLKIYVKTKMYNKLVKLLYGKGLDTKSGFNPLMDKTELNISKKIGLINDKITRGDIFSLVWTALDKNCDNAIEYCVKGNITDIVGDVTKGVAQIAAIYAISWAIAASSPVTVPAGLVTAAAAPTFTASTIQSVGTIGSTLYRLKNMIPLEKILQIIVKSWDILVKFFNSNAFPVALSLIVQYFMDSLSQDLNSEDRKSTFRKLRNPEDKVDQVGKIAAALYNHSSFTLPMTSIIKTETMFMGLLAEMPGWSEWKPLYGKKTEDNLRVEFLNWISLYCYEYHLFCKGYCDIQTQLQVYNWRKQKN